MAGQGAADLSGAAESAGVTCSTRKSKGAQPPHHVPLVNKDRMDLLRIMRVVVGEDPHQPAGRDILADMEGRETAKPEASQNELAQRLPIVDFRAACQRTPHGVFSETPRTEHLAGGDLCIDRMNGMSISRLRRPSRQD
ncbi:hypothetical protein BC361_29930 [Ensifer sp. LC54]|nr:hypothetical protein BC363_31780 [Ensifer sp. LC384]OCP19744.1 hypothetical protein BC361_29930 [Ensifer sp. LC54]